MFIQNTCFICKHSSTYYSSLRCHIRNRASATSLQLFVLGVIFQENYFIKRSEKILVLYFHHFLQSLKYLFQHSTFFMTIFAHIPPLIRYLTNRRKWIQKINQEVICRSTVRISIKQSAQETVLSEIATITFI